VNQLNSRVADANTAVALFQLQQQSRKSDLTSPNSVSEYQVQHQGQQGPETASPVSMVSGHHSLHNNQVDVPFHSGYRDSSVAESGVQAYPGSANAQRNFRNFELDVDVVEKGVITFDEAVVYFRTFFQGCVGELYLGICRVTG
jgi:hypothetical protein